MHFNLKHLPGAGPGAGFGQSDTFSLPQGSQEQRVGGGWLRAMAGKGNVLDQDNVASLGQAQGSR